VEARKPEWGREEAVGSMGAGGWHGSGLGSEHELSCVCGQREPGQGWMPSWEALQEWSWSAVCDALGPTWAGYRWAGTTEEGEDICC
jgi:hypothetical protein